MSLSPTEILGLPQPLSAGSQRSLVGNPVLHARILTPAPRTAGKFSPRHGQGQGGLAVTRDEVKQPLPSMPWLKAQPDSVANTE